MPVTHLSPDKRAHMLKIGTEVYSAYLLLDMVSSNYYVSQSDSFNLNHQKTSLHEYIISLIKQGKTDETFNFGGHICHIKLTPSIKKPEEKHAAALEATSWDVAITGDREIKPTELKAINQHQPDDLLNFCKKFPLSVSQDETGAYKFSTELNVNGKKLSLGGADKLGLYQLHLANLYTMLTCLMDEKANLNMLVAMATGSGKSFTQALWFLIQYLADNPCFFAAPSENLVAQLKRDFERLLPVSVTQAIPVFAANDPIATHLGPKWGIMSHKKLLDEHWDFLQDPITQNRGMLLCIDEEHIPSQEELFSKRIAILADHYPTMFLSATPSEEAYQISGDQPVASLSRKEKEELGISKAAVSKQVSTQGSINKTRKKTLSTFKNLIMQFVDSIEEERLSTAHEYVDHNETTVTYKQPTDPFYAKPAADNIRRFMRWNIETPIGEKALVLVDAHDPVINLSLLRDGKSENAYKNGNRVFRDNVYDFFQLGDSLDKVCLKHYKEAQKKLRHELFLKPLGNCFPGLSDAQLRQAIEENVDLSDTQKYMETRVLHGLIENALGYLLGVDSNHLDYMRFHHLDKLTNEVEIKLAVLPRDIYGEFDKLKVCQSISETLKKDNLPDCLEKEIVSGIFSVLVKLVESIKEEKEIIVDNWLLDKKLHALFNKSRIYDPHNKAITDFIKRYKTIFMVNGLEETATPIQSNRPFFSLHEFMHAMDDENVRNNDALKHKLSALEALDDTTQQAIYVPEYCPLGYSPAVVDTLFRKGLVGTYITSERVIGFNDPNLHHVGMIVDNPTDSINAPDQIIQGSGRNRGLNPAHQPHFILTSEKGTTPSFLPAKLEKKNYYPDFFKAKKLHHKNITKRLGRKIAGEIKDYIDANISPDGTVQTEELIKKLRDVIIAEFEQVYKNNSFDFKKTKKIFKKVLADTYTALHAQSKQMSHLHSLPRVAKIIACILNVIVTIYYKLSIARSYFSFVRTCRKLKGETQNGTASAHEKTYGHIVRNFNYKDHVARIISVKRFKNVLEESARKTIQFALEKNTFKYLKPRIKSRLSDFFKKDLGAYFIRFVGTTQEQIELLRLIESKSDWLEKAFPFCQALTQLDEPAIAKYFEIIKTDSEIAAYFASHNLNIELDRPKKTLGVFEDIRQELMSALIDAGHTPDFLPIVSAIIADKIKRLTFLFHPKDAAFLTLHQDKISITQATLITLTTMQQHKPEEIPALTVSLLRSSLPAETVQAADASGCLMPESYDIKKKREEIDDLLKSRPKDLCDLDTVCDLLAQNLDHYLKSSTFNKMIDYLFDSLSPYHVETLLNAIYPEEEGKHDNKTKKQKLLDFQQDLKKLSSKEIFRKYASINDDAFDFEKTDLGKIFTWLHGLYEEILACETYWHAMNSKGGPNNNPDKPKLLLKSTFSGHAIWEMHGTTKNSTMTTIAKKTQFLKATQNSFSGLSEVEALRNAHTVKTIHETARFFIQPLKKAMSSSNLTVNKKSTLHQLGLFTSAITLGSKMQAVESLTENDVRSSATQDYNAVQRMRRELEHL